MLIRKSDHVVEERFEMRGGAGTVRMEHVVEEDQLCEKGRLYTKIILKPGCGIGAHEHRGEKEIFYILKGQAEAMDNAEKVELLPGDTLITGHGNHHSIKNSGDEDLELMALIIYGEN